MTGRSASDIKFLTVSLGKSGSNWLNNIFGSLAGVTPIDMNESGITGTVIHDLDKLVPGSCLYTHMLHTRAVRERIKIFGISPFHIYRDLRDSLVSEYHHKRYQQPSTFLQINPILQTVDDRTAFDLENILQWSTIAPFYLDTLAWAQDAALPSMRFEDLLNDPGPLIRSALGFYEIECANEDIVQAIEAASFWNKSGRMRGVEDRSNFFRKGVAGDWINYFNCGQLRDLLGWYGPTLQRLGYDVSFVR